MVEETEDYQNEIAQEAEEIVKETFPKLWSEFKERMKDYSKKEVAERMYLFGIMTYMRMVNIMDDEIIKKVEKDSELKKLIEELKKKVKKE